MDSEDTSNSTVVTDDELIEQAIDLIPRIGRAVVRSSGSLFKDAVTAGNSHHRRGRSKAGRRGPPRHGRQAPPLSVPTLKIAVLVYRRGPAKVGDIAGWLGVSPPTASEQIDRMVEEGLAERRINPEDRREVLVELTPKATEMAAYVSETLRARIVAILERFEPEERPIVVRSLEVFAEVFEQDLDRSTGDCPDSGMA